MNQKRNCDFKFKEKDIEIAEKNLIEHPCKCQN